MTKTERIHLSAVLAAKKPKTLMEVFSPAPTLSDRLEELDRSPLTWQEVDREKLMVLERLITKSIVMFPSSVPLQDMHYLLQALKAAKVELDRLRLLCHEQGIVTSVPELEK